jgi:hypothetical protein
MTGGEEHESVSTGRSDAVVASGGASAARELYRRFLDSEYPVALAMAEEVLRQQPDDFMAQAIVAECRAALSSDTVPPPADTVPAPPPAPNEESELPASLAPPAEDTAPYQTGSHRRVTRQMFQRFLDSDHPGALALAEEALRADPEDRMARAIVEQCHAALEGRTVV